MERQFEIRRDEGLSPLQCGVREAGCQVGVWHVCHHCGIPLCDGPNCRILEADRAFSGQPMAVHCPQCRHRTQEFKAPANLIRDVWTGLVEMWRRLG